MSSLLIFYRGSHGVRHNTRDQKIPYHAPVPFLLGWELKCDWLTDSKLRCTTMDYLQRSNLHIASYHMLQYNSVIKLKFRGIR